jgi:hypothetical protein
LQDIAGVSDVIRDALAEHVECRRRDPEFQARLKRDVALQWEPVEDASASRVAAYLDPADPADRAKWPEYRNWAVETLGKSRGGLLGPDQRTCHDGYVVEAR